ncbi:MAG TPA: nucleotide sugar dehydrogenase [Desulfosporosinus sp.]|nr:nucleotide sugar dehydrogenase [Desulfosporosinus sp.]HUU41021.1 nucleotide sugar dehydrogenase [Desulfatiglandales bacterium]
MEFLERITTHKAVVGVIGMGYVGLPLLLEFVAEGFPAIGFDIDPKKVDDLNAGRSYIKHIPSKKIKKARETKKFEATVDFSRLKETECILVCVPTPLGRHREPDISYIENTSEIISKYIQKGQLIVLESSTFPGTTEEVMGPIIEKSGLKSNVDFFLAFSPEREDPNKPKFNTRTIPKVVGANNPEALELATALYDQVIVQTVPVSSSQAAEATKLLENIFRSVNIALVNEMKMILDRMGIDVWEVIQAASTKPFGFMPFYPGPGLGGHCIPIDPFYLTWKAHEYELNTYMPFYVVGKLIDALNGRKKSLNGSKILILGLAYKKDIDDMRESPLLKLMEIIAEKGGVADYHDPYIPPLGPTRHYNFNKKSVELTQKNLRQYDAVLISTDHSAFDYEFIVKSSNLVVDTRNATSGIKSGLEKIVKA